MPFMRYVNSTICFSLLLFAYLFRADQNVALVFLATAALPALALKTDINPWVSRVAAILSLGAMLYFFALFYSLILFKSPDWYLSRSATHPLISAISAFAMTVVLSCYSCRLKQRYTPMHP